MLNHFKKIQANSDGRDTSAESCDELLEKLKGQKRVSKMQLTKLYSRLVGLLLGDVPDIEGLLTTLEELQVLQGLIIIYEIKEDR